MKWYIAKCPTGSENGAISKLKEWLQKFHIEDHLGQHIVPYDKKPTLMSRKKGKNMSNYVFIELNLTEKVIQALKMVEIISLMMDENTNFVTVDEETVNKMLEKINEHKEEKQNSFEVGENIKILDQPFEGFTGVIEKIETEKEIITVSVPILGRQMSLELPFKSIKRINE